MAIQTLQERPGLGEMIGTGLGSGLATGLQALAQQKLQQMQTRQQQRAASPGIQRALGVNQQVAQELSQLDPRLLQEVFKTAGVAGRQASLQDALAGLGLGGQGVAQPGAPGAVDAGQPGGLMARAPLKAGDALALAKLQQKEALLRSKERQLAFKETKATRKDILDSAKADQENNMRIERMSRLNKEGKLTNPLYYSALKKVGLDIPALLSPESQEFQKLTIDFLKNAKKMFGARITNFEAETFLKSIPSLNQTAEGRERVINNLKMLYKGSAFRKKAMRDIIKENGGVPPLDLAEQIEERVDPQLDQLAAEFKRGFTQTPEGEEQYLTDTVEGGGFKKPPSRPPEEGAGLSALRNIARLGARGAEAAAGLPGDIEAVARGAKETVLPSKYDPAQYAIDGIKSGAQRFLGIDLDKINPANYLVDKIKSILPEKGGTTILPTSEELKGATSRVLPKSFAEPKNGWEILADEFVSDFVPLLAPVKGKVPFARALKAAGIGNLASFLTKQVGGGKGAQAGAKLGTMLLTSMGNPFSFKNYTKTLYPTQAAKFTEDVNNSSKILNFIHKLKIPVGKGLSIKALHPGTAVLVGLLSGKLTPAAGVMGALYGTGFAERLLRALSKNKDLRKYYLGLLKSAAIENSTAAAKNLSKLDFAMKKELPETKKQ